MSDHDHQAGSHSGDVGEHRCDDAIAQLQAFLDGELDEATIARIEAHLKQCSPCLEAYDFEAELRKVIAAKLRNDVPGDLRTRLTAVLDRLEAESGTS
ncbi:MAG: mycothiol system anti-sigma-R factor [Actinobacteria bacterium]|nr:mycothiol system anti-sigma-R factor [Actinomycetota bacterium]